MEKVSVANKMLYKKEEEEKEIAQKLEAERVQLEINQKKGNVMPLSMPSYTHGNRRCNRRATGAATGGAINSAKAGSAFLQLKSQKLRGNNNRRK